MIKRSDYFWLCVRIGIGIIFFYAGFVKLTGPLAEFRGFIAEYELIPPILIPAIAMITPWVELIFGAFLVLGYAPRVTVPVLVALCFVFMGLLFSEFIIDGEFPKSCGCFGNGWIRPTGFQVFLLDLTNAILLLYMLKNQSWAISLDAWLRR